MIHEKFVRVTLRRTEILEEKSTVLELLFYLVGTPDLSAKVTKLPTRS